MAERNKTIVILRGEFGKEEAILDIIRVDINDNYYFILWRNETECKMLRKKDYASIEVKLQ